MKTTKTLNRLFSRPIFWCRGSLVIILFTLVTIGKGMVMGSISKSTAGSCDAIAGATFSVLGISTTLNSASITWKETYRNEKRFICHGIGIPASCVEVSSRAAGSKVQVVLGLTANTKYAYKFYLSYKGKTKSVVIGSFTTNNSSCGSAVVSTVEIDGFVLTAGGDSLEHVIAKMARTSDGVVVDQDTTDEYGHYALSANPGSHLLTLTYSPFIAPAPFTVDVVANSPKTLPNQIMRNAFQLRGTVVSEGKGDSLIGAKFEVRKKSDNSLVASSMTDAEGHFSFGVVAGDYLVNVTYQGKTLNPLAPVTIAQSTDLKKVVFKQTVKLLLPTRANLGQVDGQIQELYDLKGSALEARLPGKGKRNSTILVPWSRKD